MTGGEPKPMNVRVRMLSITALMGIILGALVLAGCGGGGTTTVTVTTTATEEPTGTEESAAAEGEEEEIKAELEELHSETAEAEEASATQEEEGTCEAMGINPQELKEGRCEEEGQTVVVVNHDSPLKLKTMKVKLLGISEAKTLSSDLGSETASGTYTTFKIELTNLSHSPVSWESEQSSLYLGEDEYSEDFEVQNGYEQESFVWKGEKIQPQTSLVGTVTFDVPEKVLKKNLYSNGNLGFRNFGEEIYSEEAPSELGIIRPYH